ncbi:MAG TPA: hypothetical protein VLY24_22510 [Bryobacteraceae bacterium]|nr:hypothetical protein [Bryobacteraceae bacterium]
MEQLVYQNTRKLFSRAIESDAPLPEEGSGMYRAMPVAQARRSQNSYRLAGKKWQMGQSRF